MPTTDTDYLVSELVLIERGYDDVPKKVDRASREIDAANRRAVDSTKALSRELSGPDAHSGFQALAKEAKAFYDEASRAGAIARVVSSRSDGRVVERGGTGGWNADGRNRLRDPYATNANVATVGNQIFRLNQPTAEDVHGAFGAWIRKNNDMPKNFKALVSDLGSALSQVTPKIDLGKAKAAASKLADDVENGLGEAIQALNPLKQIGVGVAAFAAAGAATGFQLMKASAEFDSEKQALYAKEGQRGGDQALGDLKGIAKAPGIGFEESVSAYVGLRNADLDKNFSEQLIKEFANATASGGGGAAEFGRIMYQLKQAAPREYLQQEDLGPIGEAGVPINALLKKLYGTGDTEELKSKGVTAKQALHDLVGELAKMPRVAGGYQNALDNLADSMKFAEVAAGDSLNKAFLSSGDSFADALANATENGSIAAAFDTVAANITEALHIDQNGMKGVIDGLLVATMDLSVGARNLAANAEGFQQWSSETNDKLQPYADVLGKLVRATNPAVRWFTDDKPSESPGDKPTEYDTSAAAEHERNAFRVKRDAEVSDERDRMHKAGFKGYKGDWDKMPRSVQDQMIKDAEIKSNLGQGDKTKGGVAVNDVAKPDKSLSLQERQARATEQLVAMTKKKMDIESFAAGGGPMATMGITPTEMGGNRHEDLVRQAVKLLSQAMVGVVTDHGVRQGRNGSGRY